MPGKNAHDLVYRYRLMWRWKASMRARLPAAADRSPFVRADPSCAAHPGLTDGQRSATDMWRAAMAADFEITEEEALEDVLSLYANFCPARYRRGR